MLRLFIFLIVFGLPTLLNAQSRLDSTFGTNGRIIHSFTGYTTVARAMAAQADGKIISAGYTYSSSVSQFCVVRTNSNGTLDNSFGSGGRVLTSINGIVDRAFAVAIQSDGKIVVGGYAKFGTTIDFAIVRYNSNGSLDNTFSSDGIVTVDLSPSENDYCTSIVIQSNGKIVAGGNADISADTDIALIRLNINGSLDWKFRSNRPHLTA